MPQDLQHGPFTEYLTQPAYNPPQQQPSGFQGPAATGMMFVDQFLRGMSAARKRNFEQAELQRARNEKRIDDVMQMVNSLPLQSERRREYMLQLQKAKLAHANQGLQEAGKGNPIAKALSAIVGPAPKGKVSPIGPESLQSIYDGLMDPNNYVNVDKMSQDFLGTVAKVKDEYVKNGLQPKRQTIINDPRVQQAGGSFVREGMDPYKMLNAQIGSMLADLPEQLTPGTGEEFKQDLYLKLRNRGQQTSPQTSQAVAATAEPPTASPTSVSPPSGQPPVPAKDTAAGGAVTVSPQEEQEALILGKEVGITVDATPDNYVLPDGKQIFGKYYSNPVTGKSGVLDVKTRQLHQNALPTGKIAQPKQLLTPERLEKSRAALTSKIDLFTEGKPKDAEKLRAIIDADLSGGDEDSVNRAEKALENY